MTAMEYLSQAYLLDQQIRTKLQQIASLRSLSGTMQSFTGAGPVVHTRNVTSLEDTVLKIMEAEQELNAEIDRLVDMKREIAETISRVNNVTLRVILEKRHLCFEPWQQIGEEMGYTARWAQMKHRMALAVVEGILSRSHIRNDLSAG